MRCRWRSGFGWGKKEIGFGRFRVHGFTARFSDSQDALPQHPASKGKGMRRSDIHRQICLPHIANRRPRLARKKRGPLSSESGPLREQSSATSPNVIHAALTEIPTPANLANAILLASTRTSMAKTQRRQQIYSSSSSACSISSVISMV